MPCVECSATMLQWCSIREIAPNVGIIKVSGRYPLRKNFYHVRCLKCGREWKTAATYVRLLEVV